jgi:hypothetical protein
MGAIADLFAAKEAEVSETIVSGGPREHLATVEGNYFDPVSLYACVMGVAEEQASVAMRTHWLQARNADGCLVLQLPTCVRDAVAAASDQALMSIRLAFLGTTEAEMRQDPLFGTIPDWFDEVRKLSQDASATGRELYLWMCP